jgi:uncharacterized membrane protein YfcA
VRRAVGAAVSGTLVGVLGGLIGLGGAEFRLPILVRYFGLPLRRAVFLNLAVSLVTVMVAASTRLVLVDGRPLGKLDIAGAMLVGGMLGAYRGTAWLARASDRALHHAVRVLLFAIGGLLIAESVLPWGAQGFHLPVALNLAVAVISGFGIGVISSLLGVAGANSSSRRSCSCSASPSGSRGR